MDNLYKINKLILFKLQHCQKWNVYLNNNMNLLKWLGPIEICLELFYFWNTRRNIQTWLIRHIYKFEV